MDLLSETVHKTAPMSSCYSEEKERRNNMCTSGFFEGTVVEVGSPTCNDLGPTCNYLGPTLHKVD